MFTSSSSIYSTAIFSTVSLLIPAYYLNQINYRFRRGVKSINKKVDLQASVISFSTRNGKSSLSSSILTVCLVYDIIYQHRIFKSQVKPRNKLCTRYCKLSSCCNKLASSSFHYDWVLPLCFLGMVKGPPCNKIFA